MLTRRSFIASLAAATAARADKGPLVLVEDPQFRRGLQVLLSVPGKRVPGGDIGPWGQFSGPAWRAAQWYSHFNLADAKPEKLPSGSMRYFDGAKSVTFGAPETPDADLILSLDGKIEYGDHAPEKGQPWPHLLVEQELARHPVLADISAVPFHIEYHLLHSEAFHLPGWDDERHTAQFLLYITVQNGNRSSKGFGDFLWFGVPMYDARNPLPRRHTAPDKGTALKLGTGKYIYCPGGEVYSTKPAKDGEWITIDRDLLPLMRDALDSAWKAGYLVDSRDPGDYQLGGMNCGWEVTGPLSASMQIRGLRLTATGRE
jgi:hypothetical protein